MLYPAPNGQTLVCDHTQGCFWFEADQCYANPHDHFGQCMHPIVPFYRYCWEARVDCFVDQTGRCLSIRPLGVDPAFPPRLLTMADVRLNARRTWRYVRSFDGTYGYLEADLDGNALAPVLAMFPPPPPLSQSRPVYTAAPKQPRPKQHALHTRRASSSGPPPLPPSIAELAKRFEPKSKPKPKPSIPASSGTLVPVDPLALVPPGSSRSQSRSPSAESDQVTSVSRRNKRPSHPDQAPFTSRPRAHHDEARTTNGRSARKVADVK